jgi:hypothetical protein
VIRSPIKERDRTKNFVGGLLATVLLVAGVTITGCGGGETSAEGPSKADYIAKADAICTAEQSEREELEGRVAELAPITADETQEVAALLHRAAEDRRVEVRRLRALHPPAPDATPASLLSLLSDLSADLDRWAAAYEGRNATRIRSFQARIAVESARASAIAGHYGFRVCGNPGSGNTGNLT